MAMGFVTAPCRTRSLPLAGPDQNGLEQWKTGSTQCRESHSFRSHGMRVRCVAETSGAKETGNKKVLVLGGTGRVGTSTLRALAKVPDIHLIVGGRNREKGEALARELGRGTEFCGFDFEHSEDLRAALTGVDLVVHAAGPFQRRNECAVIVAALETKTAYIDVCDDREYSIRAKSYHQQAVTAQVPAITTTGIYPGVSNIMAAELVRLNVESQDGSTTGRGPKRIRYSYYTAGSGGAGPTILATSFLLLGEDVTVFLDGMSRSLMKGQSIIHCYAYDNPIITRLLLQRTCLVGKQTKQKAYSGRRDVDFGKGIGVRPVYLLNLPEVGSTHEVLGVPSVSARFGTSPQIWNLAMGAVATLAPKEFLEDQKKVQKLVGWSDPWVRALDGYAGEAMSMRVDLECDDGKKSIGIFSHKKLSVCVGVAVSAFARAVLEGTTQPGVWFPEEVGGIRKEARQKLLERASQGTINFVMNKSPWMTDANPKEIGFGIYF